MGRIFLLVTSSTIPQKHNIRIIVNERNTCVAQWFMHYINKNDNFIYTLVSMGDRNSHKKI